MNQATTSEREATQAFEIRNILTGHCGQRLTADMLDAIVAELVEATRRGPCAWAFKPPKDAL